MSPDAGFLRYFDTAAFRGTYRFHLERFSPLRRFRYRYHEFRFNNDHDGFTRHGRNVHLPRPRISRRSRFSSRNMGLFRFRMSGTRYLDSWAPKPPLWNPHTQGMKPLFKTSNAPDYPDTGMGRDKTTPVIKRFRDPLWGQKPSFQ